MSVVGYVDDVAVMTTAYNASLVEDILNPALERVAGWQARNGLRLTAEKTETVMLTRKWAYSPPVIRICEFRVRFARSIRYLSIHLDS